MKSADKSSETMRNFDQLISLLSEKWDTEHAGNELCKGRWYRWEANGGAPIIIIPKILILRLDYSFFD